MLKEKSGERLIEKEEGGDEDKEKDAAKLPRIKTVFSKEYEEAKEEELIQLYGEE